VPGIHYAQNALQPCGVSDVFDVPFSVYGERWLHLPAWTTLFRAWEAGGFWW